jgi:hypothetical protein
MTWGFTARRRAERFDELVAGNPTGAHDARDAELLELVGAMRAVPEASPRPEFVADLRERLMAEAATALVPTDLSRLKLPERRTGRERRLAAVVGGIAIVGATTSIAVASQSALPGDSLYTVKRAIESAHTGLTIGEADKAATILDSASDRLDEVESLARQDDFGDDARISDTLNTFTEQTTTASDLLIADYDHSGHASSIARLRDFASSSLDRLATLEPLIPIEARDELIRAADVLSTIDTEAAVRCPTCGGTPIDSIPPVLAGGEIITVPQAPAATPTARPDKGDKHDGKGGQGTELPDVDDDDLGPGSILDPGGSDPGGSDPGGSDPGGTPSGGSNPLQDLANGLTGGGSPPTGSPSLPSLGDVADGVDDLLHGIVDPLTGQAQAP